MKFSDVWNQLCRKEPRLNEPETKTEFTSSNLRRLLEQVYEQGRKEGKKTQEFKNQLLGNTKPKDPFGGLFG